jgi:hypothetical protein
VRSLSRSLAGRKGENMKKGHMAPLVEGKNMVCTRGDPLGHAVEGRTYRIVTIKGGPFEGKGDRWLDYGHPGSRLYAKHVVVRESGCRPSRCPERAVPCWCFAPPAKTTAGIIFPSALVTGRSGTRYFVVRVNEVDGFAKCVPAEYAMNIPFNNIKEYYSQESD